MYTFLILIAGIYLGNKLPFWIGRAVSFFQNRALLDSLVPKEVDPSRLCKGNHSWITARTFTDTGPSQVKVCRVCGLIEGTEKMATAEAIDRIEENNQIRELETRLYKEFSALEDGDIRKYFDKEIKNGLSFDKLAHVHTAGMTFGQRYTLYKASKKDDIEKELTKSNS
jgi:hypothetical protein